jgi:hypothetical protein
MNSSTAGPACGHATSAELDYIFGLKTNTLSHSYLGYGVHLMKPSGIDTYLGTVTDHRASLT